MKPSPNFHSLNQAPSMSSVLLHGIISFFAHLCHQAESPLETRDPVIFITFMFGTGMQLIFVGCVFIHSSGDWAQHLATFVLCTWKSRAGYIVYVLYILYLCILPFAKCYFCCLFNSTPQTFRQHQLHTKYSVNHRLGILAEIVLNIAMPGISSPWSL